MSQKLPVAAWIYGGGFFTGWAGYERQAGVRLATVAVVVSFNYRVAALGFGAGLGLRGNWGLTDQRLALQWIQRNIAVFGGDASHVTIFGQSAGAISVNIHMTSPSSWPLFHQAIAQSPVPALQLIMPKCHLLIESLHLNPAEHYSSDGIFWE